MYSLCGINEPITNSRAMIIASSMLDNLDKDYAAIDGAAISASFRKCRRASFMAWCSLATGCLRLSSILSKIALRALMILSGSLLESVSKRAAS